MKIIVAMIIIAILAYIAIENIPSYVSEDGQPEAEYAYDMGNDNRSNSKYHEAVSWYVKGYNLGHSKSALALGEIYQDGYGVPKNESKALEYYEKAAYLLNGEAMVALGTAYSNGDLGLTQDWEKAVYWYKCAVRRGGARWALLNLAYMYGNGSQGNPEDIHVAYAYYCLAVHIGVENFPNKDIIDHWIAPLRDKMKEDDFEIAAQRLKEIIGDLYGIENDTEVEKIILR